MFRAISVLSNVFSCFWYSSFAFWKEVKFLPEEKMGIDRVSPTIFGGVMFMVISSEKYFLPVYW